ncbi:MAG: 2-phosphosulfolactate phosphatase, partial [Planctomycetales bacterium]|nr:2-phosphosulfolactate phosphatase [Planctomycetales bacterium]
ADLARRGPEARAGGERKALRIPGFHFSNSPADYTPESIGGRELVFTTTNGTRALHACHLAQRILLAAFTNLDALLEHLAAPSAITVVCSGISGVVCREDVLLAGAICDRLVQQRPEMVCNDSALLAMHAWRLVANHELADELAESKGGRNLISLGMGEDVRRCALVNSQTLVAGFNPATNTILPL